MTDVELEDQLSSIVPSQRILLLSHCMRPSQTCPGRFNKEGLQCPADCVNECVIRNLRRVAADLGFLGVCIAAGGAQALRFVKEKKPRGIVAVACDKELEEGVQSVGKLEQDLEELPIILVVPLLKDGCVDTEVNEDEVVRVMKLGSNGSK